MRITSVAVAGPYRPAESKTYHPGRRAPGARGRHDPLRGRLADGQTTMRKARERELWPQKVCTRAALSASSAAEAAIRSWDELRGTLDANSAFPVDRAVVRGHADVAKRLWMNSASGARIE
eukprot:12147329-Prorocentrum_lima.AAC.1